MKILKIDHELLFDKDRVTVEIDKSDRAEVSEKFDGFHLQDGKEYDFDIKRHYEKRSLSANSYFHQLIGKISAKLGKSFAETKNEELRRYGQRMTNDSDNVVFCLMDSRKNYDDEEGIHLAPTGHTEERGGVVYEWYSIVRGTHTYNSREMAILIDGVVQDAKELGIETMTPDDIAHLKGIENGNT